MKNLLRVETDEAVFLCVTAQMYITFDAVHLKKKNLISLTVDASRLIDAQMDLHCLLFGEGFQIFIVTPQMFRLS